MLEHFSQILNVRDILSTYSENHQNPVLQRRFLHCWIYLIPFFRQVHQPVKILLQCQAAGKSNVSSVILKYFQSEQILIKISRALMSATDISIHVTHMNLPFILLFSIPFIFDLSLTKMRASYHRFFCAVSDQSPLLDAVS